MLTKQSCLLTKDRVRSTADAMAYLTECNLSTVSHMAGLSKPPKGELQRQIDIAQFGVDHIKTLVSKGDQYGCGRIQSIVDDGISVEEWSKSFAK